MTTERIQRCRAGGFLARGQVAVAAKELDALEAERGRLRQAAEAAEAVLKTWDAVGACMTLCDRMDALRAALTNALEGGRSEG